MARSGFAVEATSKPSLSIAANRKTKAEHSRWVGVAFVTPLLIILAALVGFPTVASLWYSFTNATVGKSGSFVGVANYTALFGNEAFSNSLINLVLIVGVSEVIKLVLGLVIGSLLSRPMKARWFWRSIVILPWAMPGFVAFMAWRLMFDPRTGALDQVLGWVGLHADFLATPDWARASVVLATVWRGFPFWVIGILAAMQTIPKELYEAAEIDGATTWRRFFSVTLPGIRGTLSVIIVLSTIWTTNGFENVWLLTQGGPSSATMTFPVLSYLDLTNFQLGGASAAAMITLPLFVALILWLTHGSGKAATR
jgi:multiple sugar transport system permease protein